MTDDDDEGHDPTHDHGHDGHDHDQHDHGDDDDDEQSPTPKFWLEFCTLDNGMAPLTPSSTTTFPQFSLLPPELRLKIWSHLVQPRIVVASCLQRDSTLDQRRHQLRNRSHSSPTPALLHVNREARDLGLHYYELSFSWNISKLLSDTPVSRPARVWFNFALDTLYLTGELEAYDSYGFNSPMVYFLRREDTCRVAHVACPFSELGYPQQESDQIFGCLWHVIDRFPAIERLLLTVTDADEAHMRGCMMLSTDNIMQKIWNGWMSGTTVTNSKMAHKQILLVKEEGLAECIASHQT